MKTFLIHFIGVVLLIILIIKYPDVMINPGDLSSGHQDLKTKCFSCHTPFRGTRTEKCLACHELNKIGVTTVEGSPVTSTNTVEPFHNLLLTKKTNCYNCHKAQLPGDFLHKQFGSNCFSCHSTSRWQIERFDHSLVKTAINARCSSCHKKNIPGDVLHQGIQMGCGECHTTNHWRPATFEHDQYFRFDRKHPPRCESCHQNPANFKQYTCYNCHEHSYLKIAANCHPSGREADAKREWRKLNRKGTRPFNWKYREHEEEEDD